VVDGLPGREVVGKEAPSAAAAHDVEESVEDLAQGVHPRASGSSLGAGRWGFMQAHSASERSVWYALLTSCPAYYWVTASQPLFRQFLTAGFTEHDPHA
jgi:hypothetical protein